MFARIVPSVGLAALLACSATGQDSAVPAADRDDEIVATVDGVALRVSDLEIGGELTRIRQEEYQAKVAGVESKIAELLIRKDAERLGLSFEEYLEQQIGSKVIGPTDDQVVRFYEQQKGRIGRPLEDVRSQIERVLQQQIVRTAHDELVTRLREGDPGRIQDGGAL